MTLRIFFLALFTFISTSIHIRATELGVVESHDSLYQELTHLQIDAEKCLNVKGLSIQRDAGIITLDEGSIVFSKPLFGQVCFAVFIGSGRFQMKPPTNIEQDQLQRLTGSRTVDSRISSLVMVYSDTTFQSLSSNARFTTIEKPDAYQSLLNEGLKYVYNSEDRSVSHNLFANILDARTDDYFSVLMNRSDKASMLYLIDPLRAEQVCYYLVPKRTTDAIRVELVCQFFRAEEYKKGPDFAAIRDPFMLKHYTLDCSIAANLAFNAKASVVLQSRTSGRRWVHFDISTVLHVDSVRLAGKAIESIAMSGEFWIQLPKASDPSMEVPLEIFYHGDIFLRQGDFIFMKFGSNLWYPHVQSGGRFTFDLTFHTASTFKFLSAGKLVDDKTEDGVRTSHWVIDQPQIHTSFSIGVFKEIKIEEKGIPNVSVMYGRGAKYSEEVAGDLKTSLLYYTSLYGPPPTDHIDAAEIYAYHGQAFPGFLHLSFITFRTGENSGNQESFVAHEVAHQWWGGGLAWSNYHDQWMSEAFAEYSSLMYMQAVLKDNKRFFKRLEEYKESIVNNRKSFLGTGLEAAPIWLGSRTVTSEVNAQDYTLIIYRKGAWIMHMLRNLMMDFDTFSDSTYLAMMQDYYKTYRGKDPTTADFKAMVDKHMKQDMSWFFNNWVYGSKVPSYTFAWKSEKQPDGQYKVRIRMKQRDVPPEFSMIMPLKLNFGDNGTAILRTVLSGESAEFDLPLLPYDPEKIEFNPYSSVLCSLETERW